MYVQTLSVLRTNVQMMLLYSLACSTVVWPVFHREHTHAHVYYSLMLQWIFFYPYWVWTCVVRLYTWLAWVGVVNRYDWAKVRCHDPSQDTKTWQLLEMGPALALAICLHLEIWIFVDNDKVSIDTACPQWQTDGRFCKHCDNNHITTTATPYSHVISSH